MVRTIASKGEGSWFQHAGQLESFCKNPCMFSLYLHGFSPGIFGCLPQSKDIQVNVSPQKNLHLILFLASPSATLLFYISSFTTIMNLLSGLPLFLLPDSSIFSSSLQYISYPSSAHVHIILALPL